MRRKITDVKKWKDLVAALTKLRNVLKDSYERKGEYQEYPVEIIVHDLQVAGSEIQIVLFCTLRFDTTLKMFILPLNLLC